MLSAISMSDCWKRDSCSKGNRRREMTKRILVVDDELRLRQVVRGYLEEEGYEVATASNGREALFAAQDLQPDLIILDLMMPEMDGWEFMRQYRRQGSAPVIMLTARVEDVDKVIGLEMGADDYVAKPFSPRELIARVRAVLRRAGGNITAPQLLRAGDLELDPESRLARIAGEYLDLTKMEFDLLTAMMSNPGRAFTRLELLERVQGFAYDGYERTIDVHIKNLRKKIEADSSQPLYILTAFGVGYRFNPEI
jgi:two-component system alkaline phosphatase synthesis response regulator PhoP